jgi:hypothetical protein
MRRLSAAVALLFFVACEGLPALGPQVTVVNQGASMECDKLSLRCHKVSCSLQSASSETAAVSGAIQASTMLTPAPAPSSPRQTG